ncbi:uncharacterized protein LOC143470513 isoform X1 [Clavelina lepadiformis]|uniref:uncharacterized protein LOC143470513 isoform X1 n=1 Tax=Clavelina lepadiformis TaxID=159417 RepID=UPI004041B558
MDQPLGSYLLLSVAASFFANVDGHGRLLNPPSRASMFRFKLSDPHLLPYRDIIKANYNDMGLNCGGRYTQIQNKGKCGICGDPYNAVTKPHEAGGKFALGIITRKYVAGDIINVTVEITAEHKGYFEFRLCPWNDVREAVTQECLNKHILSYANGNTKFYLPNDPAKARGLHDLKLKLPDDVTCKQCLLQWRYRTGNSWGSENGRGGLGLGQQEEFYGCSDVAISPRDGGSDNTGDNESPVDANEQQDVATSVPSDPLSSSTNPPLSPTPFSTTATDSTSLSFRNWPAAPPSYGFNAPDCWRTRRGKHICADCFSFFVCAFRHRSPFRMSCAPGTRCNPRNGRCVHPYQAARPCNIP